MEKNNKVLIIILLLLVILLGGYIAYDKLLSNNSAEEEVKVPDNNKINHKTTSDVAGKYTAKYDSLKSNDATNKATITLNLYENGVFSYVFSYFIPTGTFGNYVVNGDKIILTNWFNSSSDTGLRVTKGNKTLTINDDGSITDNSFTVDNFANSVFKENNINEIKLIKDGELAQFDLSNRLATAFFTESNHTISEPAM